MCGEVDECLRAASPCTTFRTSKPCSEMAAVSRNRGSAATDSVP